MLFRDALANAQEALDERDCDSFTAAVRTAQLLADHDTELIARLDEAIAQFPERRAFEAALELIEWAT